MFIPRLYLNTDLAPHIEIILDKDKSHYLINVIRMTDQDKLFVFNGTGGEYTAHLQLLKKQAKILVHEFINIDRESILTVHLGQAILRGDKMDLVIQKATELGVAAITPLLLQNAKVKLDKEREMKRHTHWQEIAISAAEQCGRTAVPTIHPPATLQNWLKEPFTGLSMVFDVNATQSIKQIHSFSNIRIATGPESGWTDTELNYLTQQGFESLLLGKRILRAETASLVALSALQTLMGDF